MNPPITNATLYFLVQYFGLDIISTLLLYKLFWLKMFEYEYMKVGGAMGILRVGQRRDKTNPNRLIEKGLSQMLSLWKKGFQSFRFSKSGI